MPKKVFVLDTNVLIHDPNAITAFEEHDIVIPQVVIRELDGKKKSNDEVGRSSRRVSNIISRLCERYRDRINTGMPLPLPAKGTLRICDCEEFKDLSPDDQIIAVVKNFKQAILRGYPWWKRLLAKIKKEFSNQSVILVSKDTNIRILALSSGLMAEDYENDRVPMEEFYTGISEIVLNGRAVFSSERECALPPEFIKGSHYPNECIKLKDANDPGWEAFTIYDAKKSTLRLIKKLSSKKTYKIAPRNTEQMFAYDLLTNEKIPLVTLVGKAGTGKDLMALLAGLEGLDRVYDRIIISSAAVPVGNRGIGFLPGTLEEKMDPWVEPFFHNINLISGTERIDTGLREKSKASRSFGEELLCNNRITIASISHMRGATYHNSFIIVSEAQNLSSLEVKTIATRVGEGSKLVFTADIDQIDVPYLDDSSCGLVRFVEALKPYSLTGHVRLLKSERSEAAELVANVL